MGIQSSINRLIGTAGAGALAATKISEGLKTKTEKTGVDAKMAAKARKTAQQKIKAIQANKALSEKAKTRRIGKVLDKMGGNK